MAGTFALSQAVQLLKDALPLPGWLLTATVIGSLALFPVVAVLAWFFDLSSDGVTRTADRPTSVFRWSAVHAAVALVAFVALMLGGWIALQPRQKTIQRVAVLPLQNRTGDPARESLGEVRADWIIEGLLQ